MVDLVKYIFSDEFTPKQTATLLNALYDKWLKEEFGDGIDSPEYIKSADEFLAKSNSGNYEEIHSIFLTTDKWPEFKNKLKNLASEIQEYNSGRLDNPIINKMIEQSKVFSVFIENEVYLDVIPANERTFRGTSWWHITDFVDNLLEFSEDYTDPVEAITAYLKR